MPGRFSMALSRIAITIAILALWEVLSRTGLVNPRLLPSATETLATLTDLLQRASMRNDLVVTASKVLAAFAIAVPFGCLLGYLIAENRYFADVMKPLLFFAFSIRRARALVIVGVVVSEMLISSAGIGYLISRYRTILDSPHVFAGVLLVLAMAIAFNAIIRLLERRCAIWQTGTRAGQRASDDMTSGNLQPAT